MMGISTGYHYLFIYCGSYLDVSDMKLDRTVKIWNPCGGSPIVIDGALESSKKVIKKYSEVITSADDVEIVCKSAKDDDIGDGGVIAIDNMDIICAESIGEESADRAGQCSETLPTDRPISIHGNTTAKVSSGNGGGSGSISVDSDSDGSVNSSGGYNDVYADATVGPSDIDSDIGHYRGGKPTLSTSAANTDNNVHIVTAGDAEISSHSIHIRIGSHSTVGSIENMHQQAPTDRKQI